MSLSQQAIYSRSNGLRVPNPRSKDGIYYTEADIFSIMGLKYIPPCLRWA
jgi:DNA polymerase beta thumb